MSIEDLDNRMFQLYDELKSRGVKSIRASLLIWIT
jgi:Cys-tRNA synthase (O-phospho-L-seryl-tRNA:Cys-tRNA synthase)